MLTRATLSVSLAPHTSGHAHECGEEGHLAEDAARAENDKEERLVPGGERHPHLEVLHKQVLQPL